MLDRIGDVLYSSPFGTAWALIENVTNVARRCVDRASDSIAMLMSVFLVISAIAISNALCRKFAQTGNGASWMIFPSASCDRFQSKHFSQVLQRNAPRSRRDVLFRPTVKANRILASQSEIGRFLGEILRESLLHFGDAIATGQKPTLIKPVRNRAVSEGEGLCD
jgi:hypothetical protein